MVFNLTVPLVKKKGNSIDLQNLNTATFKDEYLILVADMLIDELVRHQYLSFIDCYSGYS